MSTENGHYARGGGRLPQHGHQRISPKRALDRSSGNSGLKRDAPGGGRDSRDIPSDLERKRRREERERERQREAAKRSSPATTTSHSTGNTNNKRDRSPVARSTSRSSPTVMPASKKRRPRVPRYMVQVPKIALNLTSADVLELRHRYNNLYVPSDFFRTEIPWPNQFRPDAPFVIKQPCAFQVSVHPSESRPYLPVLRSQVMHKDMEVADITSSDHAEEATDADHTFCAKVMLMGVPNVAEMYQRCFVPSTEDGVTPEESADERNLVHPTRLISFLVGTRGKNETMAIGGPWSPSLDGANPASDPTVLIRTAIRTCKALTGIDLAKCTQW